MLFFWFKICNVKVKVDINNKIQERFIRTQLADISKSYLKFNFQFPTEIIYDVSKLFQINDLSFY